MSYDANGNCALPDSGRDTNGTPRFRTDKLAELRSSAELELGWLWNGYLRSGNVTLLTSQWKAGKTTLVSVLLAKMRAGGHFLGLPLRAGNATIISEEPRQHWVDR